MGRGNSGRGKRTGSGKGGTFSNESDFEKALTGFEDPRLKQYSDAYDEEASYTKSLKKNINQSIDEDGYTDSTDVSLNFEKKDAEKQLKAMPKKKTPTQLGTEKALNERLKAIEELKKRKGEKGRGLGNIDILA